MTRPLRRVLQPRLLRPARLRHFHRVMAPSLGSSPVDSMQETAETIASNLAKAIAATSHDFRSDTVTGTPDNNFVNGSPNAGDVTEYVYNSNVHRRYLQS